MYSNKNNNNHILCRCGCDKCITASKTDSLRYSMCRVNEYRALASPSLMALSSANPILTAFKLSWELRRLARIEKEFTNEYMVIIFSVKISNTQIISIDLKEYMSSIQTTSGPRDLFRVGA